MDVEVAFTAHRAASFTAEQETVREAVRAGVEAACGKIVFVRGPGGAGKTYLFETLLAEARGNGHVALGYGFPLNVAFQAEMGAPGAEPGPPEPGASRAPVGAGAALFRRARLIVCDDGSRGASLARSERGASLPDSGARHAFLRDLFAFGCPAVAPVVVLGSTSPAREEWGARGDECGVAQCIQDVAPGIGREVSHYCLTPVLRGEWCTMYGMLECQRGGAPHAHAVFHIERADAEAP